MEHRATLRRKTESGSLNVENLNVEDSTQKAPNVEKLERGKIKCRLKLIIDLTRSLGATFLKP